VVRNSTSLLVHSLSESLVWNPLGGCTWGRLLHHTINLLERQTLCLWNQEVGVDESACAETSPDEEDGGFEVTLVFSNHVRGDDSDDSVPEPVGCCGKTDTTRSDWEREDFTDENPSSWTPSRGKEEDENGDEGDLSVDGSNVVGNWCITNKMGVVESNGYTDDGDEELADQHTKSSEDQQRSATKSLYSPERKRCGSDIDSGEDHGNSECVANGSS